MRKFRGLIALVISVVLGLVAARAVYWHLNRPKPQKEPVRSATVKPQKPKTVSERIPSGMRLVGIKLADISGLPGGIQKGDRVDVLATSTIPKQQGAAVSRIVLQGVEVFSIGKTNGGSLKKISQRQKEIPVSLLVRPDQATVLMAASVSADIRLIARNQKDTHEAAAHAMAYSYDTGIENGHNATREAEFHPEPGMRAITLTAKDTDGTLGVLKPGDHVDVILTCPVSKFATGGQTGVGTEGKVTGFSMTAKTLLQKVKILTTERVLDLSVGKEEPVRRLTLLVTPAQAEKLAVASDATKKGVIRLVARHPDDHETVSTRGARLVDLLGEKKAYFQVEFYKGGKRELRTVFR